MLSASTNAVYIKAELTPDATLIGWHLEGSYGEGIRRKVRILDAPTQVTVTDWGDYYVNEGLKKYEIRWKDPNPQDDTAPYDTVYYLYKNGAFYQEISGTSYTDTAFQENAVYGVAVVRRYATPEDRHEVHETERISVRGTASLHRTDPKTTIEGVRYDVEEFKQSEALNALYGGNYTFSDQQSPPSGAKEIDQKLLGRSNHCAYGFEPINFNTGNFLAESLDYTKEDIGTSALTVFRTYNAKADTTDGPFGAKWEIAYSAHLIFYQDGSIGYRRADGSQINFRKQADGSYQGNDDDYLRFAIGAEGTEFQITDAEGTVIAFTTGGLLKSITGADGNGVVISRDSQGLLTAITAASGAQLQVKMNEDGHIETLTTPGGNVLRYTYEGTFLTAFTDAAGAVTRYEYDRQGRMTRWYDGEGTCQAENRYDSQDRVVWQKDGNGEEYTLEYFSDHTVTIDASGNRNEIWFDEQKRTVKLVDAQGQEEIFAYGQEGEVNVKTDGNGLATAYEYDEKGNKIRDVAADGSVVSMEYDANNHFP